MAASLNEIYILRCARKLAGNTLPLGSYDIRVTTEAGGSVVMGGRVAIEVISLSYEDQQKSYDTSIQIIRESLGISGESTKRGFDNMKKAIDMMEHMLRTRGQSTPAEDDERLTKMLNAPSRIGNRGGRG